MASLGACHLTRHKSSSPFWRKDDVVYDIIVPQSPYWMPRLGSVIFHLHLSRHAPWLALTEKFPWQLAIWFFDCQLGKVLRRHTRGGCSTFFNSHLLMYPPGIFPHQIVSKFISFVQGCPIGAIGVSWCLFACKAIKVLITSLTVAYCMAAFSPLGQSDCVDSIEC